MARIIRTQIGLTARPVYVRLVKSDVGYVAHEEGTGLAIGSVTRTASGKGWFVHAREGVTMGETTYVHVPSLFGAAQVLGHARSRYLTWATAERERVLADRVVGL